MSIVLLDKKSIVLDKMSIGLLDKMSIALDKMSIGLKDNNNFVFAHFVAFK